MDDRTPREVVWDVEEKAGRAFGPNIDQVLMALVEELDERYEDEREQDLSSVSP